MLLEGQPSSSNRVAAPGSALRSSPLRPISVRESRNAARGVLRQLDELLSRPLPIPEVSLSRAQLVLLQRATGRVFARLDSDRLQEFRLERPPLFPLDYFQVANGPDSEFSAGLPRRLRLKVRYPLLVLEVSATPSEAEVAQLGVTAVHELFHLYFQGVARINMSALLDANEILSLANPGASRLELERKFDSDPEFASGIEAEYRLLRLSYAMAEAQNRSQASDSLARYLEMKRDRLKRLDRNLAASEDYYEFLEGTAYLLEHRLRVFRKASPLPFPAPPPVVNPYGLATGSALTSILLMLWPDLHPEIYRAGRAVSLTRLLEERLHEEVTMNAPPGRI